MASWLGLMVLAACGATMPPGAVPPELWSGRSPALDGAFYLLTGPRDFSADLYEVRLPDPTMRRLTHNPEGYGISEFSASEAGIAMASAENGFDQLRMLGRPGRPTRDQASSPSIDERGRVLADRPVTDDDTAIDLYEPHGSGLARRVFKASTPGDWSAVWAGHGRVLVAYRTEGGEGGPTQLQLRTSQGKVLRRVIVHGMHVAPMPNAYPDVQPITAGGNDERDGGIVFDDQLHEVARIPAGWNVGCWNPGGTRLLVNRGRTVGLWSVSAPGKVAVIGRAAVPIYWCSWLRSPAPMAR